MAEAAPASRPPTFGKRLARFLKRLLSVLLVTLLLVVAGLYGVMFILVKGPSPTARNLFIRSVRETSAIGFLADLYLSPAEIAAIEAAPLTEESVTTDASLITINAETDATGADPWGLVDDDGDGIIIDEVKGEAHRGLRLEGLHPGPAGGTLRRGGRHQRRRL